MKKIIVLLILLTLTPGVSMAADKWSKQDVALESVYLALHLIDWGQTRDIALQPERFYEMNPILGKHPSINDVNIWFLMTGFLHPIITHILPENWRPVWQGVSIFTSGGLVLNNFSIGLKMNY